MGYMKKGFLTAIGAYVGYSLAVASANMLHDILYKNCEWYKSGYDESHSK